MSKTPTRAPAAFSLEDKAALIETPDFLIAEEAARQAKPEAAPRPRKSWVSAVFWSAFSALLLLYITDSASGFVLRLMAKNPALGQVALGLFALLGGMLALLLLREAMALWRMRRVDALREKIALALGSGAQAEGEAASEQDAFTRDRILLSSSSSRMLFRDKPVSTLSQHALAALLAFYARDAQTAQARAEIARSAGDILDGPTRLAMAERLLLGPKDDAVRAAISDAASRVSVFTAVSPRAVLDVLFVMAQAFLLIRNISRIYGGRASGLGLWRLFGRVLRSIAFTGGMAMADSMMGQVLGAGLAARLSARLGEGVLNGVLIARIGLAAVEHSRPMDFVACQPIILSEVVKMTIGSSKVAENPAA